MWRPHAVGRGSVDRRSQAQIDWRVNTTNVVEVGRRGGQRNGPFDPVLGARDAEPLVGPRSPGRGPLPGGQGPDGDTERSSAASIPGDTGLSDFGGPGQVAVAAADRADRPDRVAERSVTPVCEDVGA